VLGPQPAVAQLTPRAPQQAAPSGQPQR